MLTFLTRDPLCIIRYSYVFMCEGQALDCLGFTQSPSLVTVACARQVVSGWYDENC